jgi:hypothetical protein
MSDTEIAQHLRSTTRPQIERVGGWYKVWTECGLQVNATMVDNETAECAACHAATPIRRIIQIRNVYEGGADILAIEIVPMRHRGPDEGDAAWDDYVRDTLSPLTGTGRTEGNASYSAESIDGLEPEIRMEWC